VSRKQGLRREVPSGAELPSGAAPPVDGKIYPKVNDELSYYYNLMSKEKKRFNGLQK